MTNLELQMELEQEALEQREEEVFNPDAAGQDDELGEVEVTEESDLI